MRQKVLKPMIFIFYMLSITKSKLIKENQILLDGFIRFKKLERSINTRTELRYYYCLCRLQKYTKKPFNTLSRKELEDAILKVKDNKKWSARTVDTVLFTVKSFFRWLNVDVSWIRRKRKYELQKLPEDLLTEDDVLMLIRTADHIRDKALISVLYESGMRAGELLNMSIKDIVFDDLGAIARVSGKTGDRRIRLVFSASYLRNWIDKHPLRNNRDASMWVGIGNRGKREPLQYKQLSERLRGLAIKCKIKKPVNPHHFRHSRASFLAKFLTESQLKVFFGWTQGSGMAQVYVHLSGRDVDDALLSKVFGLKKLEEAGRPKLVHTFCLRCKEPNSPEHSVCQRCSFPLEAKAVEAYETSIKNSASQMVDLMKQVKELQEEIVLIKEKR
jgi:integrase